MKRALVFLVFTLLVSCGANHVSDHDINIIDVDLNNKVNFEINIEEVIVLETTNASLFGHTSRLTFIDDRIVILDGRFKNSLLIFDRKGTFQNKTKQGKAPGECLDPVGYYVDYENKTILLFDGMLKKFQLFDLDLGLVDSWSPVASPLYIRWFSRGNSDSWLVHHQNPINGKKGTLYSYVTYDSRFSEMISAFLVDNRYEHSGMTTFNPISRESGEILFFRPFDQHLYSLQQNDQPIPTYYLNFGDNNLTDVDFVDGMDATIALAREGERVMLMGNLINTTRYVAITYFYGESDTGYDKYYVIYDKTLDRSYTSLGVERIINGNLVSMFNDSTFVMMVEPGDFTEYIEGINEDVSDYPAFEKAGNDLVVLFTIQTN